MKIRISQLSKAKHQADDNEEYDLNGYQFVVAKLSERAICHIEMPRDKPLKPACRTGTKMSSIIQEALRPVQADGFISTWNAGS